jgi:hypothetical protein
MDFSTLKKLEPVTYSQAKGLDQDSVVQVIVKVRQENYIPDLVKLRVSIDGFIFTADCIVKDLETVEKDSLVESISMSKRV